MTTPEPEQPTEEPTSGAAGDGEELEDDPTATDTGDEAGDTGQADSDQGPGNDDAGDDLADVPDGDVQDVEG